MNIQVKQSYPRPVSAATGSEFVSVLPVERKTYPRWPSLVFVALMVVGVILMSIASTRDVDGVMLSPQLWCVSLLPLLIGGIGFAATIKGWIRD